MDISKLEKTALSAAVEAGNYLLGNLKGKKVVKEKEGLELVSDADIKAQKLIIKQLRPTEIDIVAEEEEGKETETCWLVDPIDGSTNYIHGLPIYSISIGLKIEETIRLGIVHAPNLRETFVARMGAGAYLNNELISVSKISSLADALLATGFPYDLKSTPKNNFNYFRNFSYQARAIRRCGCASLDLAYVACGRFDGFWEMKLKSWDTAAGLLLVEEAGGRVTDFSNQPFHPGMDEIAASNGKIHQQLIEILKAPAQI